MKNTKPAIIVFRHAEDLPTDAQKKAYFEKYHKELTKAEEHIYYRKNSILYPKDSQLTTPIPEGEVTVPWHRLSDASICNTF